VAAIYLLLYAIGRFLVEGLRIDPAEMVGPFRFNQAASVFAVATALIVLVALDRRRPPPGRHRRR
jgi:prolipoprotein diacylglyceryltransferase